MSQRDIIMSFSVPPSADDLKVIAADALEILPEELIEFCDSIVIEVEEMADEVLESELDLDDPFDLPVLFRKGSQISPGVESKVANDDDLLIIFRRPILDIWCDTQDDINMVVRQAIIEELGQNFDFSDEEIDEMSERQHQGMF